MLVTLPVIQWKLRSTWNFGPPDWLFSGSVSITFYDWLLACAAFAGLCATVVLVGPGLGRAVRTLLHAAALALVLNSLVPLIENHAGEMFHGFSQPRGNAVQLGFQLLNGAAHAGGVLLLLLLARRLRPEAGPRERRLLTACSVLGLASAAAWLLATIQDGAIPAAGVIGPWRDSKSISELWRHPATGSLLSGLLALDSVLAWAALGAVLLGRKLNSAAAPPRP